MFFVVVVFWSKTRLKRKLLQILSQFIKYVAYHHMLEDSPNIHVT